MSEKIINLPALHPLQEAISCDEHRFRVVSCGRRWGKSFWAIKEAFLMVVAGYQKSGGQKQRCWVVAPTFPLVREDWLVAEDILKDAITKKHQTEMKMDTLFGFIEFKSAEREDEGLRGAGLNCCVIDEASRVSRKSWEQGLRPALADKLGRAIFISTPKGKNWFYDMYRKGQENNPEIKSWQYPTYTNPYFPKSEWETIVKTTPELILKQEYLADFLDDEASVFRHIDKCLRGAIEEPIPGEVYTIGLDLARAEDFTVAIVIKNSNCQVVNLYRQNQVDWSLQKKQIVALAKKYSPSLVYVDSTGIGDPIEEDLRKSGVVTRAYHLTNSSKMELVEQLMVGIEQQLIGIPDCLETKFLVDELKAYSYEVSEDKNRRIFYSAPEGLHDDGVIALGLATRGVSFMFYNKKPQATSEPPKNSAAWLEKRALDNEIEINNRLPRRLRKKIEYALAFS